MGHEHQKKKKFQMFAWHVISNIIQTQIHHPLYGGIDIERPFHYPF